MLMKRQIPAKWELMHHATTFIERIVSSRQTLCLADPPLLFMGERNADRMTHQEAMHRGSGVKFSDVCTKRGDQHRDWDRVLDVDIPIGRWLLAVPLIERNRHKRTSTVESACTSPSLRAVLCHPATKIVYLSD
jgi:hypothetical protein